MGSDMSMNPPTQVTRVVQDDKGALLLQQRWNYEPPDVWATVWEGEDTEANRDLIKAATGITDIPPMKIKSLRARLEWVGVDPDSIQAIVEQVAHWLEDHANDELRHEGKRHRIPAGEVLAFHAKEALAP